MLQIGTNVAGYQVKGVLGHGGMGVVYEATQLSLDRTVALKVLAEHLSSDPAFRERFRREGQIQAAIDHPNIVTIYEAGEDDEGLFLAMRLIRGPSLKDLIMSQELEGARTLRLLGPIADALDTAHEAGLIHRDIKPQNILVGARDHAYLADFGLTKGTGHAGLTRTGQFVGTIDYIAPEQIRGESVTSASDIYGFAAVLYECLTGVIPYPKESDAAVLYAHLGDTPPLVTDQRPDLPEALDEVIARAMSKDPRDRHPTATGLIEDAEHAFGRRVRAVITPPQAPETPQESGIRPSEGKVPTRQSRVRSPQGPHETMRTPDAPDATKPSAPEPATASGAAAGATRPAGELERPTPEPTKPGVVEPTRPAADRPKPAGGPTRPAAAPTPPAREPTKPAGEVAKPPAREPTKPAGEVATGPAPPVEPGKTMRAGDVPARGRAAAGARAPGAAAPTRATRGPARGDPAATRAARAPGAPARPAPLDHVRRRPAVLVAAAVVLLGAILGFVLGGSGSPGEDQPTTAGSVASGELSLAVPSGWRRVSDPAAIRGLEFSDPVTLSPSGDTRRFATAGMVDANDPTLLSADFTSALESDLPRGEPVRIGNFEAYRYTGLRTQGSDAIMTLYAVPTSAGVATLACQSEAGAAASFASECERLAATMKLDRAEAYGLGPSEDYARELDKTMNTLNTRRAGGRIRLRAAGRSARQARAAGDIATAYSDAAEALADVSISPALRSANDDVVRSFRQAAAAYERLAGAARARSRRRYEAARGTVSRREAAVSRQLESLTDLGYAVGS